MKSNPIFIVLDSLYYQNPDSGIYKDASTDSKYQMLLGELDRILYTDLNTPPRSIRDVPFSRIFSLVEMIIYSTVNSKDILVEVMRPTYLGDYFLFHTLNVTFLTCQTAIGLGFSYRELTHVCVTALLHDIGMKLIDQDAFTHSNKLSETQRSEINRHFKESYLFFEKIKEQIPFLLQVIHDEDCKIQNKPIDDERGSEQERSKRKKWHTYTEIISGCNTFEALCHDRPFRKAYHPADAMRIFVEQCKRKNDRKFIRAIIESITLYPITSLVKLNNKRIAQVIDIVEGYPLSPVVAIIKESDETVTINSELTGEIIDLSQKPTVFIESLVYNDQYTLLTG